MFRSQGIEFEFYFQFQELQYLNIASNISDGLRAVSVLEIYNEHH
jgi:hypothetical protein